MHKIYIVNNVTNLNMNQWNFDCQTGLFHIKYDNYGLLIALYKEGK